MKPRGDICSECENAFEPNTARGECRTTGLCHRCCVESEASCWDGCAQVLSEIADDNAHDYAYQLAYA